MRDQVQVWKMYRASKHATRNTYLGTSISVMLHVTIGLGAILIWWQEQHEPQPPSPIAIQLVEVMRPLPKAKPALTSELKGQKEIPPLSTEEALKQVPITAKTQTDGSSQLKYGQIISSHIYEVLTQYIKQHPLSLTTFQVFLEIDGKGKILKVQLMHNDQLTTQQVTILEQQIVKISLPASLDNQSGHYMVPISLAQ